jgi:leucyl aminopeptidase (aminopeptidase T)
MKQADVVIMPTTKSLSHTTARIEATGAGARAVTLPTITTDIMQRTLNADYEVIKERSIKLAEKLTEAKTAKITAPNGTDLELVLESRSGHADTGIYQQSGEFGNLPAGEAYIAPVEGTVKGKLVVDGSMSGAKVGSEEIELIIEEGSVVEINGKQAASDLQDMIAPYGQAAKNIAELGIGTNDQAQLSGNILEDEKVWGTAHVAIGDNSTMGGNIEVASHLDGIIEEPTIILDGQVIINK